MQLKQSLPLAAISILGLKTSPASLQSIVQQLAVSSGLVTLQRLLPRRQKLLWRGM
jgi:hypothetical protein